MATTNTETSELAGFSRMRDAEQAVWDHYALEPVETLVDLGHRRVMRVHEVGTGAPIMFVHGSGGSGAYWAPLAKELAPKFRCILIDRPGWTLSTPVDYSAADFATIAATLIADLLDSLRIDSPHLVGGSIGNLFALRFAQKHPERVASVVLLGGGPLIAEIQPPTFIRLLRSPLGRIIISVPQKPGMVRKQMEGLGHTASFRQGRIPDELVQLYVSTGRFTAAMKHERALVKTIVDRRDGFIEGLTLTGSELREFSTPTTMIYGSNDPVGSHDLWKHFVSEMPSGALYVVTDGGHLPWYDKPREVADLIKRHAGRAQR